MILDFAGTVALGAVPLVTGELWLVAASAFAGGFGGALWSVNARTISQQLVPDNLRGRYSATARLIGWGTLPLGAALAGGLGELIGPRPALAVLAVPVAMMAVPFMRVLDVDGRWEPEPVKVSDDV
jgi:MFS family permease